MDQQRLQDVIRRELDNNFRAEMPKELREQVSLILARELYSVIEREVDWEPY